MIGRLRGTVAEVDGEQLILDVGGVGYAVLVPERLLATLRGDVTLWIYTAVREDAITLYGFGNAAEKKVFEQLISVSQVGPRIGLSALSALSVDALAQAINGGDVRTLSSISGIGKKTAERLILELKGKLSGGASTVIHSPDDPLPLALGRLGYKPSEIDSTLQILKERGMSAAPLQARLAEALRIFAGGGA